MNKLHKQVDKAQREFDWNILAIAKEYRKERIVPACKKYNLSFMPRGNHIGADEHFIDSRGNRYSDQDDFKNKNGESLLALDARNDLSFIFVTLDHLTSLLMVRAYLKLKPYINACPSK